MKRLMERLQENIAKYADRPALVEGETMLTYRGLDEESGKIYAYLKEKGIGKEKIVMLIIPRDIHFMSCMVGVWKAGAASIMFDEGYPAERVEYIYKDTGCEMVLDRKLFEEIMQNYEPLPGYEETDLHDAAYAVYTSGSTGNPKGVLHEYGNVDQCASSLPEQDFYDVTNFGFIPPLSFVASYSLGISALAIAATIYPISAQMLRNFPAFTEFIEKEELDRVYLPPSFIRLYKNPAPSLKIIDTGSEPANGIYYEGGVPVIHNNYNMSEAGFSVLEMNLDRAYDVAPVGKPSIDIGIALIDDEGRIIEGPGQGELIFRNEFVRGYINLPEQNAKAFKNGYYHTADICRRDENGFYYVVGRADDMIKINGNRIEPAEIEAVVKNLTGLKNAAAKGFNEGGRSYIALYYLKGEAESLGMTDGIVVDDEKIKKMLPSYMIPTYYVPLEAFPINPNGKLSRKDLKAPAIERNMDDFVEPVNETEKYFCDLMAGVLKLDPYSAADDFFLTGGDSLRAMMLVSACDRFELSSKDVYLYRTPQKLAAHFQSEGAGAGIIEDDETVLQKAFPLLDGQIQNVYYQSYAPDSNFRNLPYFIRLKEDVNPERLAAAVNRSFSAHPALRTRISKGPDGSLVQQYQADYYQQVEVQEVTEAEIPELIRKTNASFEIEDTQLYRCRIFRTEKAAYFFFVIHHVIADGASSVLLLNEICRLYEDDSYVIPKDHYFAVLAQIEAQKQGAEYEEVRQRFRDLFEAKLNDPSIPAGLVPDTETKDKAADIVWLQNAFDRKDARTSNLLLTACALAAARFNRTECAFVTSVYGNRDDKYRMNAAGLLASNMLICVDAAPGKTAAELLSSTAEQASYGIMHTEYSIVKELVGDTSDMIRFNYQKDTLIDFLDNPLEAEKLNAGTDDLMTGSISVNVVDSAGEEKLHLAVRYAKNAYRKESIERFIKLFTEAVRFLESGGTI